MSVHLLLCLLILPCLNTDAMKLPPAREATKRYEGHQVFRVYARSAEDREFLNRLKRKDLEVQFWTDPSSDSRPVDIMVSPKHNKILNVMLKTNDMEYHITIPDVEQAISEQKTLTDSSTPEVEGQFSFSRYHTIDEINAWLEDISTKHSDLVSLINLGTSWEGRPIYLVKISTAPDEGRQAIWLDAGIHANEWIGPATMLYFIQQLVSGWGEQRETMWIMSHLDMYILPVFNPDGYAYTWTEDRLWRKNRSQRNGSDCIGVDLNRNWHFHWAEGNSDHDSCGRMYVGPSPESEPEVSAVVDFLKKNNDSILAYLAYHSFSQFWMLPYSYTKKENPPNILDLVNISKVAVSALEMVHGTKYFIGRIADLVGEASGASVDYVYSMLGVKYAFGIELRDNGRHGTLLPANEIIPNAEESWAAIQELAIVLIDKMYLELEEEAKQADPSSALYDYGYSK